MGKFRWAPGEPWAYYLANVWTETAECLIWPYARAGGQPGRQYGSVGVNGRHFGVHELACQAWNGPRPPRVYATHGPCHQRLCFNGAHLSWGLPRRNALDRYRDGTSNEGERNAAALLTAADVRQIADDFTAGRSTQPELAAKYHVNEATIYNILAGRSWKTLGISVPTTSLRRKLTLADARAIRLRYAQGDIQQKDLALQYGVGRSSICVILQGKQWIDIGEHHDPAAVEMLTATSPER